MKISGGRYHVTAGGKQTVGGFDYNAVGAAVRDDGWRKTESWRDC